MPATQKRLRAMKILFGNFVWIKWIIGASIPGLLLVDQMNMILLMPELTLLGSYQFMSVIPFSFLNNDTFCDRHAPHPNIYLQLQRTQ